MHNYVPLLTHNHFLVELDYQRKSKKHLGAIVMRFNALVIVLVLSIGLISSAWAEEYGITGSKAAKLATKIYYGEPIPYCGNDVEKHVHAQHYSPKYLP